LNIFIAFLNKTIVNMTLNMRTIFSIIVKCVLDIVLIGYEYKHVVVHSLRY